MTPNRISSAGQYWVIFRLLSQRLSEGKEQDPADQQQIRPPLKASL
jgi:hypothetical protein